MINEKLKLLLESSDFDAMQNEVISILNKKHGVYYLESKYPVHSSVLYRTYSKRSKVWKTKGTNVTGVDLFLELLPRLNEDIRIHVFFHYNLTYFVFTNSSITEVFGIINLVKEA